MPLALWALTLSAFAIGTTEFVIVGLIPTVAADLGVTLPSAGLLVSLYALGVAVGAPVLTALTGKLPRKALLLALMALFTAGNLLAWQAPRYETLVAARILTGLAHGVFFSIGSTIATGLVPREKAASAIAIMFTGLTVALVTGVPLGTFIGQHFGWRATFLAVAALGVIAIVLGLVFEKQNIAFMVGLAFSIAASANFPVLFLSMFWKGLTTRGAVIGGFIGLASAVGLIILGPTVWVDVMKHEAAIFPYKNPALFSMTLAFFFTWLFSVLDTSKSAAEEKAKFDAQFVRSMTGIGASGASKH